MIHLYFFQDEFALKENINVDKSNIYTRYNKLSEAKIACGRDAKCIGIYDPSCDKNGPFMLLKNSFVTSFSSTNCIYKKKDYGKLSFL